jgi:hypothetical protein
MAAQVPFRVIESEPVTVNFLPEDWFNFETAYGRPLPEKARQQIAAVTNAYLCFAPFDNVKPTSSSDALKRINSIHAHALKFRDVLSKRSDKKNQSALQYGEQLIAKHFDSLAGWSGRGDSFTSLTFFAGLLVAASERAKAELLKSNGIENLAWDQWINAIRRILSENNLPCGASKSGSSTFVDLIHEIQKHLPERCRRHMPMQEERDALAQGDQSSAQTRWGHQPTLTQLYRVPVFSDKLTADYLRYQTLVEVIFRWIKHVR